MTEPAGRRAGLAVVIAAHDSAGVLPGALESVASLTRGDGDMGAGETWVVDGGSTDGTVDLAIAAGARVVPVDNPDNPHASKNIGMERAGAEWILVLDSDERVGPALAEDIRRVVERDDPDGPVGWWMPRLNHLCGRPLRHGVFRPDLQLRLVRRGRGRYPLRDVHEHMDVDGPTGRLQGDLVHLGSRTIAEELDRARRYGAYRGRRYRAEGRRVRTWRALGGTARAFLQSWVWRGGWRDGAAGFFAAGFWALRAFSDHAHLWQEGLDGHDGAGDSGTGGSPGSGAGKSPA